MATSLSLPRLRQAVKRLEQASILTGAPRSPKMDANSYLDALAFLLHLQKDQETLRQRMIADKDSEIPFPGTSEIPAMATVLHNERIFVLLVRCLHASTSTGTTSNSNASSDNSMPLTSRKRALSLSGDVVQPSKALKTAANSLSPMPGRKPIVSSVDHRQTAHQSPTFCWPVWAATVLSIALQYVDHWPVPLVYAYAVDSFGARSWVDDPDCTELVENLALVTNSSSDQEDQSTTPQHAQDAAAVATAYRNFSLDSFSEVVDSSSGHIRRPSLSSSSSSGRGSNDGDGKDVDERHRDGGASSSGEEEDDDKDVLRSESNHDESKLNGSKNESTTFYPVPPRHGKWIRVRARYFGSNLEAAHQSIGAALQERIDQKSKQNSGLLQALPKFTSIPKVRYLVTQNLEKWLQSPALAGLSRTLFASTVENMKNVDPPLPDDLQSINHILAMNLKANQFAAHMENVTAIATRIPTATVANHIYANLLQQSTEDGPSDESLSMLAAIHNTLPAQISYEAMAYSILMLLVRGRREEKQVENQTTHPFKLIRRLRQLLRSIAAKLAPSFDGFQVLSAFLELETNQGNWSVKDEEDKARLMFQCVTLFVASIAGIQDPSKAMDLRRSATSPDMEERVRCALRKCRRVLLQWCCGDYGPSYSMQRRKKRDADIFDGSAAPDFVSAIGPNSQEESVPLWLNTMRCLLLIEEVDSDLMNHFLSPPDASDRQESGWTEEKERIRFCASFGADVDDEMISVILASASESESDHGMSPDMSIKLLEHLFESCGKRQGAVLKISDPDLVWEMYKLAHYSPSEDLILLRISEHEDYQGEYTDELTSLPRLAFTGLWWRVTVLGLVICGSNPEKIGSVVWRDHPTISSLIKMVTSGRYRFPTVDCDEERKSKMKDQEQSARDEEARVAELLFLPPKKKKEDVKRAGFRMSRRLLRQQEEKEAAAELAEANRRKKLLRSAQKAIMLWDPDGPARKPPRESAELLVSADSIFDLSNSFQRCTNPDFLLSTIGGTSRSAIERAYDWLIPIMSRVPDTIGRLPSSTSCFLLLRAYGADGERREQLRELSSPLLYHVRDSLRGSFGEAESIQAFDILLADVGSYYSDRRKSARRVLQDALGKILKQEGSNLGSSAWMMNITHVEHAPAIVPIAMSHLASAAKYERGKVLKSLVMALQSHSSFAQQRAIPVAHTFPLLLSLLVSQRPNVYAEAIDTYPDFRSLVVRTIYDELIENDASVVLDETHRASYISIKLRKRSDKIENKVLPMSLLETTCIVLSGWSGGSNANDEDALHVKSLVDALMLQSEEDDAMSEGVVGLASAINASTNTAAMTVDSWIMLCKARNDTIGKRAALSVPEAFLGRLLLSSGLPRMSLLPIVDRISRLGKASIDMSTAYRNLLIPSASSEWDIGRVGNSTEIARRLLGRLSAYLRAGTLDEASSKSFIEWLQGECRQTSPLKFLVKNGGTEKSKISSGAILDPLSIFDRLQGPSLSSMDERLGPEVDVSDLDGFLKERGPTDSDSSGIFATLKECFSNQSSQILHDSLLEYTSKEDAGLTSSSRQEIALLLARQIKDLASKPKWAVSAILRWLPLLSSGANSERLWNILFAKQDDLLTLFLDELILLCVQSWSKTHLDSCTSWINSLVGSTRLESLSARRLVDFLLKTSSLGISERMSLFSEDLVLLDPKPEWGSSEAHANSLVKICILAALESADSNPRWENRNSLPSWYLLLELVASRGKRQLVFATDTMIRFQKEHPCQTGLSLLDGAMLRLYLLYPTLMNVGSAPVRQALVRASEARVQTWNFWRSSLDDLLEDAIGNLAAGDSKVARILHDHARKHPLLIFRQSRRIVAVLEDDATFPGAADSSQVVEASSLGGPAEARWLGKDIMVHVKHWGFSYTELLWNTVLDVFASMPKEVLFQNGIKLGFLDVLQTYVRLFSVQVTLLTGEATAKLKLKLTQILAELESANTTDCHAWWNSTDCDGVRIRNLLALTDLLSPQVAIQSLRS